MSSRATKFYSRAPRYTLNPSDNRFLRYARESDTKNSYTTRFVDISQSGLAFVTDAEHAPHLSDLIKLEIPLTETETVAWWGRVVRIEEHAPRRWYKQSEEAGITHEVLVGITFHELPEGHARLIRRTLAKKFEEQRALERQQRIQTLTTFVMGRFWQILLYAGAIAATVFILQYLSRPSLNYDADKGAPWGERFPQFKWTPDDEKK